MRTEIREPETPLEWKEYYQLRYNVLRAPLGKEPGSERNEGDETGVHFAMYKDDKVVAIARLDCADKNIAQVRFVAVDPNFRGMGYGKKIMKSTEEYSKKRGDRKMILHARDYAVDFYLGLGYKKIEKSYKLFGALQHYLMEKVY